MNILDLEPDAFMSALDELQLPADQRDMLLRQYRKGNSPLARLYEGIQSVREGDEGRVRGNILPLSRPEGMTGYEAIKEGEAEFAVPEFLLGGAESLLNVLDMPGATLRGPVSRDEMAEVAMETAGTLALPSIGARPDPNVARMFGGRGTKNEGANRAMDRAEELWQQGESPEDIWAITAEEFPQSPASVLPDGRPFYEMSDAEAVTRDLALDRALKMAKEGLAATDPEERALLQQEGLRLLDTRLDAGTTKMPLQDVLSHPQLYDDVPDVGRVPTLLRSQMDPKWRGEFYQPSAMDPIGRIHVSSALASNPTDQIGTTIHETQHGVASLLGSLPAGSNPETIRRAARAAANLPSGMRLDKTLEQLRKGDSQTQLLTKDLVSRLESGGAAMADFAKQLTAAMQAPYKLNEGKGRYSGAYGLYRRDPGEALARLSDYRREMSMAERGATTPMETLMTVDATDWDKLVPAKTPSELLQALEMPRPQVEGLPTSSFAEAADMFVRNNLPLLEEEVRDQLKTISSKDAQRRREVIIAGRNRINEAFDKFLEGYR